MAVTVLCRTLSHKSIYRFGFVGELELPEAYTLTHEAEGGTVFDTGNMGNSFHGTYFAIHRNFVYYDTNGVGVVEAARLVAAINKQQADADHSDVYITEGSQNTPMPISTDFGAHKEDVPYLGALRYDDMVWYPNYIVFNELGRNWINRTGNTLFCTRVRGDVKAWVPTGTNRANFALYSPDIVSVDVATDIGTDKATLNGTFLALRGFPPYLEITHDGANPTYPRFRFEWGLGWAFDTYTDWQYGKPLGGAFSADLTGLSAGTYRYKAVYEDADGQEKSDRETFEILPGAPPAPYVVNKAYALAREEL